MFEKKFGFLRIYFIAMSVLAIVAVITSFVLMRLGMKSKSSEKMVISASFYPEYVIAVNLLEGTEVGVTNLTANVTGCVHDYQLTTADMKNIEESIAVVINGGHMDHFAADAVEKASGGLVLDEVNGVKTPVLINTAKSFEEEYENPHYWMNVGLYEKQISEAADGLVDMFRLLKNKSYSSLTGIDNDDIDGIISKINENESNYISKLSEISKKKDELNVSGVKVVCFHEALEYLAEDLGMSVKASLDMDYDTALSAGDLKDIEDTIKKEDVKYILAATGYTTAAEKVASEMGIELIVLDAGTSSSGEGAIKDSYINMYLSNLNIIAGSVK